MVRLYNTAQKQKVPLDTNDIKMYCCGPTVYHFAHIGNMRAFVFEDLLVRMLMFVGKKVTHVMNITDVGHLTSDADDGEDKMLKGAKREGKTVWDIADFYTKAFFEDATKLNIKKPDMTPKATDHIAEMIDLIKQLEEKGFTYIANGNVYFDVQKFPEYPVFANLNMDDVGKSRVDVDEHKKHPRDFVLWFTQSKFDDQAMKWDSPWGTGYPGWHIECSAMSHKYLGAEFDIHCGGEDHIPIHHTNEIAQSCCGYDAAFARIWMHCAFLIDQTGKMSKSKGDFLTVSFLEKKGYDPLALRYLFLQTHYRKQLQFSFEALDVAQTALLKLRNRVQEFKKSDDSSGSIDTYLESFKEAISDDVNVSKALGILYDVLSDDSLGSVEKYRLIIEFDKVFGLDLDSAEDSVLPDKVTQLLAKRADARAKKNWLESDMLRDEIKALGFDVKDKKEEQIVQKLFTPSQNSKHNEVDN